MRIFLTLVIAIVALGGTQLYTQFANSVHQQSRPYQAEITGERFSLELIRTFTAIPSDRGAIDSSTDRGRSDFEQASILILFKGEPIMFRQDEVAAAERLVVERIPNVEIGENEIFVKARVSPPAVGDLAAMQIRVLAENQIVAESVFTSYPGSPWVYGTVTFNAGSTSQTDNSH